MRVVNKNVESKRDIIGELKKLKLIQQINIKK